MPEILKSKEEKSKFNGTDGRIMSGKASFKEKRRLITPMHCVCNWVKDVEAFLNFRKATNRQVFIFGEVEDFLLGADEFGITFGLCAIDLRMSVFKNTIKRASKEGAWEIQMDLALCLLEFKSEVYSSDGELFRVNPNGALDLAYLRSYLPRMEVKTQWDKVIRM